MAENDVYELYAIRYATRPARRHEHFIGGDPHDAPMPMDYFVWLARNADRAVLIDIGCTQEVAERRGRSYLVNPVEAIRDLGVDPATLSDVIITHLHYDHVGTLDRLPKASFHLQERELAYATGPEMRHPFLSQAFEAEDIAELVRLNFRSRVRFYAGQAEPFPGITLHLAGGHSHGLQFVTVNTRRGKVVLASDVAHFYENLTRTRPFHIAYHVGEMLSGFEQLNAEAAGDLSRIIPGHDPLVTTLYPTLDGPLAGVVYRLDVAPKADPAEVLAAQARALTCQGGKHD